MAKMSSRRVMDQRKRDYDRIQFTIPKGASHLLKSQALREGVSSSELLRRAILDRCGLSTWPDFTKPEYNFVVAAGDKGSADEAIESLQIDEYNKSQGREDQNAVNAETVLISYEMRNAYIKALRDMLHALEETEVTDSQKHPEIRLSKNTIMLVMRLLSNIDKTPEQDYDLYADCWG